jgi:hypothetical protein
MRVRPDHHALKPVGTPLDLLVELRPGEETEMRGQVIRVTSSESAPGLAIYFAPLPPGAIARIESFLAHHSLA